MSREGIGQAILVAAIYGLSFVAIRLAVTDLPPLLVTGYRFFFAALPLMFFVSKPPIAWKWLAAYGFVQGTVMFGLAFTAIAWGMPAGLTSLVVQMQVFFTIAFAALAFGERPDARQVVGMTLGFGGIASLALATKTVPLIPFFMIIGSAAAWGVANLIAKSARVAAGDALGFVVWSSLFGAIPLFILSMVVEGTRFGLPDHMPKPLTFASIAFLAIVTQVFAFALWVRLLNLYRAPQVMPFALLIPVFGIGSTALVFGEAFTLRTAFASVLIFAGLAITIFRPAAKT